MNIRQIEKLFVIDEPTEDVWRALFHNPRLFRGLPPYAEEIRRVFGDVPIHLEAIPPHDCGDIWSVWVHISTPLSLDECMHLDEQLIDWVIDNDYYDDLHAASFWPNHSDRQLSFCEEKAQSTTPP